MSGDNTVEVPRRFLRVRTHKEDRWENVTVPSPIYTPTAKFVCSRSKLHVPSATVLSWYADPEALVVRKVPAVTEQLLAVQPS